MENNHFGKLTERMHNFREELLNAKPYACAERAVLTTESYRMHADKPVVLKRAYMLRNILEHMTIYIEPQTLLAGNQASDNRAAPIFPEYAMDWVMEELDRFEKRDGDVFYITEETKEKLRELAPYWEHNTTKDRGLAAMPESSRIFYDLGIIKAEGNITSGDAHLAVEYEKVMRLGLKDYERRTREAMERLELTEAENLKKFYFYQAILIVIEAVKNFASRYSVLALAQAAGLEKGEPDEMRRAAELREMARILSKVPYEPAESFAEAMQSMWLIHLVLQIESNGHSLSYGRMDQYLYPYYQRDIEKGSLTKQEALEILECLWLKFNQVVYLRNQNSAKYFAGFPIGFNIAIGGVDEKGNDTYNDLSLLCLKAQEHLGLPQPNLSVRLNKNSSHELMQAAIKVVSLGSGMPQFFNDEAIIQPMIEDLGIEEKDARNYAIVGCVELTTHGNNLGWSDAAMFNLNKVLELTLNHGKCLLTKQQIGLDLGSLETYKTYQDLENAFQKQIDYFIDKMMAAEKIVEKAHQDYLPTAFLSTVIDDCLEKGLDVTKGGATYNLSGIQMIQVANLADSLAAIKQLVYDDKMISQHDLLNALQEDFKGYEIMQTMLLNKVPKYGNDVKWVDELGNQWACYFREKMKRYTNYRGGPYHTGMYTVSAHVPMGENVGASPDGRNALKPLADGGMSPVYGRDLQGPTAVLKSVSMVAF